MWNYLWDGHTKYDMEKIAHENISSPPVSYSYYNKKKSQNTFTEPKCGIEWEVFK